MADIKRSAEATWKGDVKGGGGRISSPSGVLESTAYSFGTRFENEKGTNPEELLAASHAACFSMAFTALLGRKGHAPEQVQTKATCFLTPQQPGGFKVTKMRLETRVTVSGLDEAAFQELAREAEASCPISNALRNNLEIELDASMA